MFSLIFGRIFPSKNGKFDSLTNCNWSLEKWPTLSIVQKFKIFEKTNWEEITLGLCIYAVYLHQATEIETIF